jgi:hypothetical protein
MKCLLPSFVTDFVQVISWLILDNDESTEISIAQENLGKTLKVVAVIKLSLQFLSILINFSAHKNQNWWFLGIICQ